MKFIIPLEIDKQAPLQDVKMFINEIINQAIDLNIIDKDYLFYLKIDSKKIEIIV